MSNGSVWSINRTYQVLSPRIRVDLGLMSMKGTPYCPKLQSLTIRLICFISWTQVGEVSYPSAAIESVYSTVPANWADAIHKRVTWAKKKRWAGGGDTRQCQKQSQQTQRLASRSSFVCNIWRIDTHLYALNSNNLLRSRCSHENLMK